MIKGYTLQDGCWNCRHQFTDGDDRACNLKNDMPMPNAIDRQEWIIDFIDWMEENHVDDCGKCPKYERRKEG